MNVKEAVHHIKQTHAGIAGGLRKEVEWHRDMSSLHKSCMQKAVVGDDYHECAKAKHDDMATDRETRAQYHDQMMDDCDKALKTLTTDDLNKSAPDDLVKRVTALENTIIPSQIRGVAPDNPMRGVIPVPRLAQNQCPKNRSCLCNLSILFASKSEGVYQAISG